MKRASKQYYERLKAAYMREVGYEVPKRYQSAFIHWGGGVEVQYIYGRFADGLPKGAKVLIVGVMGGRDYYFFRNLGYDVEALDIGPQHDIEPVIIANVEEDLPYPDDTFDGVLIGEVLEHLELDTRALKNVRRVLKPAGRLIVSIPFYNDWEEGHVRIHSPVSARRLLQMGGFQIIDYLERPPLCAPNFLNRGQHAFSLASYLVTGRTAYSFLTRLIGGVSWRLGHMFWLRPFRRHSRHFGGYFLCQKGTSVDHLALNRRLYTAAPESSGMHSGVWQDIAEQRVK